MSFFRCQMGFGSDYVTPTFADNIYNKKIAYSTRRSEGDILLTLINLTILPNPGGGDARAMPNPFESMLGGAGLSENVHSGTSGTCVCI